MTELICLNSESATNRLVLLHGWGADANDLVPVGKLLTEGLKDRYEIVSSKGYKLTTTKSIGLMFCLFKSSM